MENEDHVHWIAYYTYLRRTGKKDSDASWELWDSLVMRAIRGEK